MTTQKHNPAKYDGGESAVEIHVEVRGTVLQDGGVCLRSFGHVVTIVPTKIINTSRDMNARQAIEQVHTALTRYLALCALDEDSNTRDTGLVTFHNSDTGDTWSIS